MDRKREQAELLVMLGQLFGPMLSYAENPIAFGDADRARLFARFFSDRPRFQRAFVAFTQSEPGHFYLIEQEKGMTEIGNLERYLQPHLGDSAALARVIREKYQAVFDVIYSIPMMSESTILEAHTPFSAYCFIRDRCTTTRQRLRWIDRYMDPSLFYRFLRDVSSDVVVSLVTLPSSQMLSAKDKARYTAFIDVSRLFASERGQQSYQLVVNTEIHDRWLCCDDELYALGGSAKDAGQVTDFTVSRIDPNPENFRKLDDLVSSGLELFGPSQPTHLA